MQRDSAILEWDTEYRHELENRRIEYILDESQSIVSENRSPDIPFRFSLNPYRGCIHGCSYCYARNSHEFLGFSAGLDFETKIIVKPRAAQLFGDFLSRPSWQVEPITFSGVTDCYQPAERQYQLTRGCLEVARDFQQPVSIVTKNALVVRDLEILRELAKNRLVHVFISITTLDAQLAREMEPRTSIPSARLRAIGELCEAGVPVGVMLAPIVPGLNDCEVPEILAQAKKAGAAASSYILLRLPQNVALVFEEWLQRTHPQRSARILGRLRTTRRGQLNTVQWGERMVGVGEMADQIRNLFIVFRRKHGLDQPLPAQDCSLFRRPGAPAAQRRLF